MRSYPASYSRLCSFLLPADAACGHGVNADQRHGCLVEIGRIGLVTIMGPSREAVFDQAARILRMACAGLPALSIACSLYTKSEGPADDGRDWLRLEGSTDRWTIIVNGGVSFSPTGLEPYFPDLDQHAGAPVALAK